MIILAVAIELVDDHLGIYKWLPEGIAQNLLETRDNIIHISIKYLSLLAESFWFLLLVIPITIYIASNPSHEVVTSHFNSTSDVFKGPFQFGHRSAPLFSDLAISWNNWNNTDIDSFYWRPFSLADKLAAPSAYFISTWVKEKWLRFISFIFIHLTLVLYKQLFSVIWFLPN